MEGKDRAPGRPFPLDRSVSCRAAQAGGWLGGEDLDEGSTHPAKGGLRGTGPGARGGLAEGRQRLSARPPLTERRHPLKTAGETMVICG